MPGRTSQLTVDDFEQMTNPSNAKLVVMNREEDTESGLQYV